MINQPSFEHDTVIDLVVPAIAGETVEELRNGLGRALLAQNLPALEPVRQTLSESETLIEELQSSGIGGGVGVAALRVPALRSSLAILTKFKSAQNLPSPDGSGVDIFCLLLYPESENAHYLRRLSRLTRLLRNADLCAKIRETNDVDTIRSLTHSPEGWMLAA
jgi:PTS system nitrogen regulatory IIA component